MSSQESVEDVISDTPPTRKNNRKGSDNGSDIISASPPKKSKRTRRMEVCTKETVKQDTALVFRYFLLRSESITEKDLEVELASDDLETDADTDDDAELSEEMKEAINDVAKRLGKIGDDFNKKYEKPLQDTAKSLIKISVYAKFRDAVEQFCSHSCGNDPSKDSLALVVQLMARFVQAAKDAGRSVHESAALAEQYLNDVYAEWIEENGGWGTAV